MIDELLAQSLGLSLVSHIQFQDSENMGLLPFCVVHFKWEQDSFASRVDQDQAASIGAAYSGILLIAL